MTTPAWQGNVVNIASYVVQIEYDCTKNLFKERRFVFYDVNGTVIEALPDYDGYKLKQVDPKSVREVLKNHACESQGVFFLSSVFCFVFVFQPASASEATPNPEPDKPKK